MGTALPSDLSTPCLCTHFLGNVASTDFLPIRNTIHSVLKLSSTILTQSHMLDVPMHVPKLSRNLCNLVRR